MDTFLAVEKILHFHHTTSRQPLRVALVRLRAFRNGTPVTMKDIETIRRVWPEAYRVWNLRGNLVMDAPDLPQNAQIRRDIYMERWNNKENTQSTNEHTSGSASTLPAPPAPSKVEGDNNKGSSPNASRILMGRLAAHTPRNTKLSLLERIREKEAMLNQCNTTQAIQASKDKFLKSQVPKLKRVLDELASTRHGQSLEIGQIMEVLRTNMFKLGDSELERALQLLVQVYPSFCSIVTVGETTHVKLKSSAVV